MAFLRVFYYQAEAALAMKILVPILLSLLLIIPVYGKVIAHSSKRSIEEKLGYLPQKEVMKVAAMDHKSLSSEWLFFKVITYYGGQFEDNLPQTRKNIEYPNMYRFLNTSTYIDPYNIDSYYFAQAIFTWEIGKVKEVNYLLERGAHYRTWDYYLPFFLGFNNFYFLKDFKEASRHMEQAARLTNNPFFASLAARFRYESAETDVAISFLKFTIERTWNEKVKLTLETRLRALEAVDFLEKAAKSFQGRYHRRPGGIEELLDRRIIEKIPEDPYGGKFYMDEKGKIRTTSELTLRRGSGDRNTDRKPK